jgi:hypothetical protein
VVAKAGGLPGGEPWLSQAVRVEWGDLLD